MKIRKNGIDSTVQNQIAITWHQRDRLVQLVYIVYRDPKITENNVIIKYGKDMHRSQICTDPIPVHLTIRIKYEAMKYAN